MNMTNSINGNISNLLWNAIFFINNLIYKFKNKKENLKKFSSDVKQENPVIWWVVVIVAVIAIVVIMAACKALGGEYGGEFSVLGILKVKVKCKS